jgi:hypothetical protein
MRTHAFLLVLVTLTFACKRATSEGPHSVSDQSNIPVPPPSEPDTVIVRCYEGTAFYGTSAADLAAAPNCAREAEGCLDPQPVLVRRSSHPEQSTIVEEWVEGATESTYPSTSMQTMTITGASFQLAVSATVNPRGPASEQEQLSWTGEGELSGEPWQSTAWTSKQARRPPVTDVVTTRLEGDGLYRDTAFTLENGSIALLRSDALHEFPCAEWDARSAATLSAPAPI